jgi:putative membrane-bound dehydrogenase-like protein
MCMRFSTARRFMTGWYVCVAVVAAFSASSKACAADFQLNNRTFHLPDGFTIELIAGPPVVDRPITADFDEQGRLYVSDSSGSTATAQKQLAERPHRILRLEDTHGDGHFDKQTVFADHMMFPEGTMWLNGSLYVAAPPSIWKLTDTDGDGVADQRSEWFEGKTLTGCANDLHGPYLGPDGWIYWCKGAFAKQTYMRANGKEFTTRAAHIFRSRPDGSGIEPVMTGGMDNPVEVAFTAGGERIFTTTFLQNPANGRRDGLIHAVYGGIYGKVNDVIDDHIRTGPDLMPVLAHLGPAASCGLTRYESEVFGKEYRDNLFSTSFNLHKVFRHILKPDGATFACKTEDFLTSDSLDFHPTHLIEDADGSLIVVDTGGWYKLCCPTSQIGKPDVLGGIYRVRRVGGKKIEDPRGLKIDWSKAAAKELATLLADSRPAVQKRAIATLVTAANSVSPGGTGEGLAKEALRSIDQLFNASSNPRARLNAVWVASQINGPDARATIRAALVDKDEIVTQAACHATSIWHDQLAVPDLLKLLNHQSLQVRRAAAEALGRSGRAEVVSAILDVFEKAPPDKKFDRVLEHSLIYALIEVGTKEQLRQLCSGILFDGEKHASTRRAALVVLDQTGTELDEFAKEPAGAKLLLGLLDHSDEGLRQAVSWVIDRHPVWGDAVAAEYRGCLLSQPIEECFQKSGAKTAATVQAQLAALAKSPSIQALLADVAADPKAPRENRLYCLRAMTQSSIKEIPSSWLKTTTALLADGDWKVIGAATDVICKFAPKSLPTSLAFALLKLAGRDDMITPTRLAALAALPPLTAKDMTSAPPLSDDLFKFVADKLAPDAATPMRSLAAEILGRSRLSHDQLVSLAALTKTVAPLEIDQLLGAFSQETADDSVAAALLDSLSKSKSFSSLRADTVRRALKKFGPKIQEQTETLLARLTPDAAKNKARLDSLLASQKDGDVRRGQLVFNSAKAACASCHTIGYVGGKVGPDLTRIGAIRAERDLLESIVFPSSSFVQSFEPIIVETNDGDVHSGILRKNDNDEVLLVTGPDQEVRIGRKEIKAMRPGAVSVMPAGLDQQLTPQELTDLVTFLKACK